MDSEAKHTLTPVLWSLLQDLGHPIGSQFSSSSPVTIDVPLGDMSQGLLGSNQLTTIDQSELSAQLGLGLGGGNILQRPQSPENPLSASPTTSLQDDDMDDFRRVRLNNQRLERSDSGFQEGSGMSGGFKCAYQSRGSSSSFRTHLHHLKQNHMSCDL